MGQAYSSNGPELNSPARMWGHILLLSVLFSGISHALFGLVSIWKLLMKDYRAIFTPLVYFIIGSLYGLSMTAAPSALIVGCYSILKAEMVYGDAIVYAAILVCIILFFSAGKTSILYSF